jgi:chloramphenicol 3-O phosphotransferase
MAVIMSANGLIIWLNGPAGAGKTSLAEVLEKHISSAKCFSIDEFEIQSDDSANRSRFLNTKQFQFFQKLKNHIDRDGTAIVDYILFDHLRDLEIMQWFCQYPIYLIEIFCPIEVLKLRETKREGKRPGQTHLQYILSANRWICDLKLDSNLLQTEEMGQAIIQHIRTQEPIGAFAKNLNRVRELLASN